MRKSIPLLAGVVTTAILAFGLSASVNASAAPSTTCHYTLVAGAPWASVSISSYYTGHVQCAATVATAIGYYRLTGQTHN